MTHLKSALTLLSLFLAVNADAKLTVHEWGTFTSLVGSNGKAQDGMYHEDEVLPNFVHNFAAGYKPASGASFTIFARGPIPHDPSPAPAPAPVPPRRNCSGNPKIPCEFFECQMITQKMETPVVYFYGDKPQKVTFDVSFPGGIISQSYPATTKSFPDAIPGVELKNGFASYEVNVLKNTSAQPPYVAADNIYSHARNVASDLIQVGTETEKFIFYRGLGEFKTTLLSTSRNGALNLLNQGEEKIPAAFLIYSDGKDGGDIIDIGSLNANESKNIGAKKIAKITVSSKSQDQFLASARSKLLKSLVAAGLNRDEALSMVDTWEHGYFKTPGLRVLYILSRHEVEKILPAKVTPAPEIFNRVFVGRIEVLLDTTEKKVLSNIIQQQDQYDVNQLGRMAQPILSRTKEVAREQGFLTSALNKLIESLIAKIQ